MGGKSTGGGKGYERAESKLRKGRKPEVLGTGSWKTETPLPCPPLNMSVHRGSWYAVDVIIVRNCI